MCVKAIPDTRVSCPRVVRKVAPFWLECTGASLRSRPAAGPGTHPEAIERLVQLYEALDKMHEGAEARKELECTEMPRDGFQVINVPT